MEDARTRQGGSSHYNASHWLMPDEAVGSFGPSLRQFTKIKTQKTTQNSCRHTLLDAFLLVLYILLSISFKSHGVIKNIVIFFRFYDIFSIISFSAILITSNSYD